MKADSLIGHIQTHSSQLEPLPTGETAITDPVEGLKAVVFDIYGTLFISGSGDISLAQSEDRSPAIVEALSTAGFQILKPGEDWSGRFLAVVTRFRDMRKQEGIDFPEVRIEEVWKAFTEEAKASGWLHGSGNIELAIIDHECRVNPCWPMPGLLETLEWLKSRKLALGIVSNAQFYTPLLFSALIGNSLAALGFDEQLSVWSFKERIGKPSPLLYETLAGALAEKGIEPQECLYIGNDLRNDIWPASELGFRTVLFAGDARSLRWRKEDPDCAKIRPDRIVISLEQLRKIVP